MVEQNHKELFLFVNFFFLMPESKSKTTHKRKNGSSSQKRKTVLLKTALNRVLILKII